MARRRRRSLIRLVMPYVRLAWAVGGVAVFVACLALAVAVLLIDPNDDKPQIAEAVRRATGRELSLRGPIHVAFGLPPTLVAEDVALAAPPGGSRAEQITLDRLELSVQPLSWLSHTLDIGRITLIHPDVLLETDAAGQGDWHLAPQHQAEPPAVTPAGGASPPRPATRFAVRSLRIRDMTLTWHSGTTGATATWRVPRLDAEAGQAGQPMLVSGQMASGNGQIAIAGEIGALGQLLDPTAATPWPLRLTLEAPGTHLGLQGTLRDPAHAGGFALTLDASGTDLSPFAALVPASVVTAEDATLSVRLEATGRAAAHLAALTLHAVNLQLPGMLPGLMLRRADVAAPGPDQPVTADVQAEQRGTKLHLVASVGTLAGLLPGAEPRPPVSVDARLEADDASLTLKGTVQAPAALSGLDLAVAARVPNLALLGPLLRRSLPPLPQVVLDATVTGTVGSGATLHLQNLHAALRPGDVTGDLQLIQAARPLLSGTLNAQQLDLDGLLALLTAGGKSEPAAATAPLAPPPVAPSAKQLLSDQQFELGWLDRADADLRLGVASLRAHGVGYSNVETHVLLQNGHLVVDPLSGDTPGGKLQARFSVDAGQPTPQFALALQAPEITLQPLAVAFGEPDSLSGEASVDADLRAAGRSPHALAASLDGHLGVSISNGDVDNSLLALALGEVFKAAKLPDSLLAGGGRTKLKCLATRLDMSQGRATVATLVLDTTRLLVEGSGSLDLGHETLALQVRPLLRAGPGIMVPTKVDGSFLQPKVALDPSAVLRGGVAGGLAALAASERGGDPCPTAIAVARGSPSAAAAPASPAAAPPAATAKPPKPIDVLRRLLR